jgi:hypothetical protein
MLGGFCNRLFALMVAEASLAFCREFTGSCKNAIPPATLLASSMSQVGATHRVERALFSSGGRGGSLRLLSEW